MQTAFGKADKRGAGRRGHEFRQKIKTPVRLAILTLLAVTLGLKFYSWNADSLLGNRMPMPFGYGISIVLSGSMEPTLQVDDLVFVRETQDIAVGDIIVYQRDGELIIHRVIAVDGSAVITQGDANSVADEPFSIDMVKGKMVACLPGIGVLVRAIKTPFGTIALLTAAVLLVELSCRSEKSGAKRTDTDGNDREKKEMERID